MATYRTKKTEIKDNIRNKNWWEEPIPKWFEGTAHKYESRYRNIQKSIRDGKYTLSDPDFLLNLGLSLGKSTLIRKRIRGELPEGVEQVLTFNPFRKDVEYLKYESKLEEEILVKIKSPKTINEDVGYPPITFPKNGEKSKVSIVNVDGEDEKLELNFIPTELNHTTESRLASLLSVGRNNPFYHYAGSEDTIAFTIDWTFENDSSRQKAIQSARKLESWSKSNGYVSGLPRVMLVWGKSSLYSNSLFLVEAASYTLKNWVDYGLVKQNARLESQLFGLTPQTIHQDVILKRVTEFNWEHEDISLVEEIDR